MNLKTERALFVTALLSAAAAAAFGQGGHAPDAVPLSRAQVVKELAELQKTHEWNAWLGEWQPMTSGCTSSALLCLCGPREQSGMAGANACVQKELGVGSFAVQIAKAPATSKTARSTSARMRDPCRE